VVEDLEEAAAQEKEEDEESDRRQPAGEVRVVVVEQPQGHMGAIERGDGQQVEEHEQHVDRHSEEAEDDEGMPEAAYQLLCLQLHSETPARRQRLAGERVHS
jgi:hypothetical protein